MKLIEVNTVNTRLNDRYDFGIHAAGCADLTKGVAKQCQQYEHDAASPAALVMALEYDLAADFGENPGFSFKVFPCCYEGKA